MIVINSNVRRNDKQKLLSIAKNTVKKYHLPRYKDVEPNKDDKMYAKKKKDANLARKRKEALKRVAGITGSNANNNTKNTIGRMIPTAMRIRVDGNYNTHVRNELKNEMNRNKRFKQYPDEYNHVSMRVNSKGVGTTQVVKTSGGMNSSNTAVTRLRKGDRLRSIPWQWSCPIPSEIQAHQYTGAIASTRLGNEDLHSNPTKNSEGYVPTGLLLYHSAGSGKTLLMLLTCFFWMIRWWGKQSVYSQAPSLGLRSSNPGQKGICNVIIIISDRAQINAMKGHQGIELFMSLMNKVASNTSSQKLLQFKNIWTDFVQDLPEKKVVLRFSNEEQPQSKLKDIDRYPDKDAFGTIQSWRRDDPIAMICKGYHPFFKKPVPTMGMIQASESEYTDPQASWSKFGFPDKSTTNYYIQNLGNSPLGSEFRNHFSNNIKGYAQLNIYLQNITYAYSIILATLFTKNTNDKKYIEAYKQLKTESMYGDYRVAKGAYHQFTEEMITQLYSRVRVFTSRAAQHAALCLAGPDGTGPNGMRLHYKNVDNDSTNGKGIVDMLIEGDFVRFRVGEDKTSNNLNFDTIANLGGLTDEREAFGGHWKEWTVQNKGGVSPFYKVMSVKKIKYGENKEFAFLKLQRMMIHRFTEHRADNIFDPIFYGDSDAVITDKAKKSQSVTAQHSNIKKGFQIYDVVRPTFQPQQVDPIETICDSADMRMSQQFLPAQALKLILANSGAEMRDKKTYTLAPKETNGTSEWGGPTMNLEKVGLDSKSLWWVAHGEHPAWGSLSEQERKERWVDFANTNNGKLQRGGPEDLLLSMEKNITTPPMMPKTIILGMTSQMTLQLFHKLPDGALFIVDEIQKYVGNQDKPVDISSINNIVERQNLFCMLSEAVKPKIGLCNADKTNYKNNNVFSNEKNNGKNKNPTKNENYEAFCKQAADKANNMRIERGVDPFARLPHLKPLKHDSNSKRKFQISPGGGQIQAASATPSIVSLDTRQNNSDNVNELERMFRLIGACRNLKITPVSRGMLQNRVLTLKNGRTVRQNIEYVKKLYRKAMERYLREARVLISFIDLSMDVTKVPISTSRGRDRITGSTSVVEVDIGYKNRNARMRPLNFGTGERVEERIGYPSMFVKDNGDTSTTTTRRTKSDPRPTMPKPPKPPKHTQSGTTKIGRTRGNWTSDDVVRRQMTNNFTQRLAREQRIQLPYF